MKKVKLFLAVILGMMIAVLAINLPSAYADEVDGSWMPEFYIKAINPGYTVDGVSNVGEMIEVGHRDSDAPISLAGLTVGYTNSSGTTTTLVEFPEHSFVIGETILLRLASSPGHELAALNYAKTLALKAGPLVLMQGEEIIDGVCWTGKENCAREFKSSDPTTLVRNMETGEFEHIADYEPVYDAKSYVADEEVMPEEEKPSQCKDLRFSEILSYYDETQAEQFVEFYNAGPEQILMDGCQIKYKNKLYLLNGIIKPDGYFARYLHDFSLTKNPTTMNALELIDTDGRVVDRLEYYNGQRKGAAYAWIGYDAEGKGLWKTTFAPTPGEPNNYQEFRTCEEGKVINEATGNCVKVTEIKEKICPAGQYLNPLTGRCRKIEVATTKTCKEGYVLNEETGRCRKVKENNGAGYSLVTEEYEETTSFVAVYLVIGVVLVGVIYAIYEFRHEIVKIAKRMLKRSS